MTQPLPPAGWYPERGVLRFWDGYRWTERSQPLPVRTTATQQVSDDPRLLRERALVFRHKAELIEHHGWSIVDGDGSAVGSLVPIGAKTLERLAGSNVELRDEHDALVHTITEGVVRFKAVTRIDGLGKITQGWSATGKFTITDEDDRLVATVQCTGSRSTRFLVRDADGAQIGTIDYKVVPLNRILIDRYEMWVHLDHPLTDPLTSLVLATVPRTYRAIRSRTTGA
ncbi:DUF2510 domain-containing protein [Nocardia concava]|uniref:DUF2510 domain-containing protein n=1 Tax=Nocardia concava TaxID=257281 RepID=UPI0002FC5F27|nr:DUF2510 domain-containing protein [Nocardia concava]